MLYMFLQKKQKKKKCKTYNKIPTFHINIGKYFAIVILLIELEPKELLTKNEKILNY